MGKNMDKSIRILLAEDQSIIRQGLHYILDAQLDMQVVAEAVDGEQALQKSRHTKPDLVLMDIRMPHLNGIEATRTIVQEQPTIKVVLLTTFDLQAYVIEGIRAGAVGYLLKDTETHILLDGIRAAVQGSVVYRSTTSGQAFAQALQPDFNDPNGLSTSTHSHEPITEREHEILQQMAFGHRNTDIARILSISEGTVKSHVHSIIQKLGVQDRTQAVVLALRCHLVR